MWVDKYGGWRMGESLLLGRSVEGLEGEVGDRSGLAY